MSLYSFEEDFPSLSEQTKLYCNADNNNISSYMIMLRLTELMPIHFLTSKSDEKLHNITEHDKGEADKETKGATEV